MEEGSSLPRVDESLSPQRHQQKDSRTCYQLSGQTAGGPIAHHNDHPVSKPLIGVGQNNYQRIGSYFVIVSNLFNNLLLLVTKNALVPARCQPGMQKKSVLLHSCLHRGVHHATRHANPASPHARGAPAGSTIVRNAKAP